jgi:hypothetical protein
MNGGGEPESDPMDSLPASIQGPVRQAIKTMDDAGWPGTPLAGVTTTSKASKARKLAKVLEKTPPRKGIGGRGWRGDKSWRDALHAPLPIHTNTPTSTLRLSPAGKEQFEFDLNHEQSYRQSVRRNGRGMEAGCETVGLSPTGAISNR